MTLKLLTLSKSEVVESINDTTTVSSHQATNEKTVNEIELNYWLDDFTLSGGDIDDLHDIASECPYSGGGAVFRARSLHDIITNEYVNWDSLANCSGLYRLKNPEQTTRRLLVYPNPSEGVFTMELLRNEDVPVMLEIYDVNGRKVRELKTNSNPAQVDASSLPQGIYTIKILLESGETLTGRAVILH